MKYNSFEEMIAIAVYNFVIENTHKVDYEVKMPKDFVKYLSENKGGTCGINSMILKIMLNKAGLKARRVILNGDNNLSHKIVEVFYNGKWHVYDADIKIRFDENVKELIKNPNKLDIYKKTRYRNYINTYLSKNPKTYLHDTKIGEYLRKIKFIKLEKIINILKK